jgi:hypothetical protein
MAHSFFLLHRVFFILLFGILLFSESPADEIKIKTTVTAVTVFTDQALVTRTAKENISSGTHKILIFGLPWGMIDQSLKVSGSADHEVKISDIKIDQIFLDTIPETKSDELNNRLVSLRLDKNGLERSNTLFQTQFNAVDAMKESYTKSLSLQNPGQKASVEEWDKLLQFVEKKKSEYTAKMETLRKEIDATVDKIHAVEEELKTIGGAGKKQMKQISVTVSSAAGGMVKLEVSYLVYEATWIPTYEVRATSSEKSLQLVYSGYVKQASHEDWNNVDLILSTAKPAMSENLPVLTRWNVDMQPSYSQYKRPNAKTNPPGRFNTEPTFTGNTISGKVVDLKTGEPLIGAGVMVEGTSLGASANSNGDYVIYNVPEGTYNLKASSIGYQSVYATGIRISNTKGARQTFDLSDENIQSNEVVISAERPRIEKNMTSSVRVLQGVVGGSLEESLMEIGQEESFSSNQVTSSTFSIPSKQTIPSDNQNHKVGISIEDISVSFTYTVVPKEMPAAFMVGKGKNPNDYPLLGGEANIFLDNAFVASVRLNTVMPGDSFSVNLGVDEGIRVERKLINRFSESVGTFSTKTKITFEYENIVENHKKYPVDIMLFDQVPVSSDEKIAVETLDPDPKTMKPDVDGVFKWNISIQPGEKKSVKLKFSIEFPPGNRPSGL